MSRRDDKFDEILQRHLKDAPTYEGFTIQELAILSERPWPSTKHELELMEIQNRVEYTHIGRAKLYRLKKQKKKELG